MRALITGARGFVGTHLARYLRGRGDDVAGVGRGDAIVLDGIDTVFHLATTRTGTPTEIYEANVLGASRLLEAIVATGRPIRTVIVGSSAMYGDARDRAPQTEDAAVRPVSAYGASKASADLIAQQVFLATGLPVMRARPFNVIGPGQRGDYFTAVCARQLVEIERGRQPRVVKLGNLDASRDFLDVRDLVTALVAIAERGEPGEAYNVCSGRGVLVRSVVEQLRALVAGEVTIESAPPRGGAIDVPFQAGSFAKLHARTGWTPQLALEQTLRDILDDWRAELA